MLGNRRARALLNRFGWRVGLVKKAVVQVVGKKRRSHLMWVSECQNEVTVPLMRASL